MGKMLRPDSKSSLLPAPGKARHLVAIDGDVLHEHSHGPDPEGMVPVEAAVDHEQLFGFAVARHAEHLVEVPLVVAVAPRTDLLGYRFHLTSWQPLGWALLDSPSACAIQKSGFTQRTRRRNAKPVSYQSEPFT